MKLLSPVGNLDALKLAVQNGADEVYLGINNFNARNNIDGFNMDTLKTAVDYAHVFGVKVNLAINILFKDEELDSAVKTIVDACNIGVDSFIVQDLGLAGFVHKTYPEVELHASTQMGLHNLEGVEAVKKYGFKRIVLARETPLNEIKRIKEKTGLEIEYFIQGALCVSFSGNCYMSSYLCGASGNRGKCKQLCRLPFTLLKDGKPLKKGYLLSAKDFMMIDRLKDLKEAGVDVLKIEGRARRPFYVGAVTREYRKALDGQKIDKDNIKLAFNRDYTEGYLNGNSGLISAYNNHIGIRVGEVKKVNVGKRFNEVYFSSNRNLSEKSTFKLFDGLTEKNSFTAYDLKAVQKGLYLATTTQKVSVGERVHLIVDAKKEEEIALVSRKRKIQINLSLEIDKPIYASAIIGKEKIEVFGEVLQLANSQPLTEVELVTNFNKSEYFDCKLDIKKLDNVFFSKRALNEFRRAVHERIFSALTKVNRTSLTHKKVKVNNKAQKFEDFQLVSTLDEKLSKSTIVYSPQQYVLEEIKKIKEVCESEGRKCYLDLPNFALNEDISLLKNIVSKTGIGVVVNNYYALNFKTEKVAGAGLNVFNGLTAEILNMPLITAECELGRRVDFPYMTLRHCPFKSHLNATCSLCPFDAGYELKTDDGKKMKIKRKKLSSCTFYLTD